MGEGSIRFILLEGSSVSVMGAMRIQVEGRRTEERPKHGGWLG